MIYEADCLSIFAAKAAEELKRLVVIRWLLELLLEPWEALTLLTRVCSCFDSNMMLVARPLSSAQLTFAFVWH